MTSKIHIRAARPDDAPLAAAIFRLSMGPMADYLFGHSGAQTEIALMRLFSRDAGRLGFRSAQVIESHRPLGMLVAFPGAQVDELNKTVTRYLLRAMGLNAFGFLLRTLRVPSIHEAEADEFFISNIAVLPAAQKHGLGTLLFEHAEEQAVINGLSKTALLVSPSNGLALDFAKKRGYEIVETHLHDKHVASYHRLVKKLS